MFLDHMDQTQKEAVDTYCSKFPDSNHLLVLYGDNCEQCDEFVGDDFEDLLNVKLSCMMYINTGAQEQDTEVFKQNLMRILAHKCNLGTTSF